MNVWEPDWYLAERLIEFWLQLAEAGVAMEIEAERRERDGSFAREAAQVRAWVSLRARWVSLRARWVTLRARARTCAAVGGTDGGCCITCTGGSAAPS